MSTAESMPRDGVARCNAGRGEPAIDAPRSQERDPSDGKSPWRCMVGIKSALRETLPRTRAGNLGPHR